MKGIRSTHGEFELIDRLVRKAPHRRADLLVGVGDDTAVIETGPAPTPFLLATTDILVENSHFSRRWSEPQHVGIKAVECNVSDIAAMGGTPTWMFISLVLAPPHELEWAEALYDGIAEACTRHGVILAGGDTTRGDRSVVNVTLLGQAIRSHLCLRSHAKPGDRLMVTGPLGGSAAALELFKRDLRPSDALLKKHLVPACRLDASAIIAPLANAMIDISDGLASEVRHICNRSGTSARIDAGAVPLYPGVTEVAEQLTVDPITFALGGGEDFELLFSIAPDRMAQLATSGIDCVEIGVVLEGHDDPVLITTTGETQPLLGGYDHFAFK